MDIKHLKYFVSIVDEGGFSEAARKLYVSQPNLSRIMKSFEQQLDLKLFYREGNHTKITEEGERLYQLAKGAIETFDDVFNEIFQLKRSTKGIISLGIPPIIGTCLLPGLISSFNNHYPDIRLQIEQKGANAVQESVFENRLEVGFTITPVIQDAFQITPVVRDENVLIVHRDHPLADRESVDYSALKNEDFILFDAEYTLFRNIMAGCHDFQFEPKILFNLTQWDMVVKLVREKMGISILPRRILDIYPEPDVAMIRIDHRSSAWDVVMITSNKRYVSPAVKRFTDFVADYFKETK